jgi:beta-lactam-binding protein with PASTA domain
VPRLIGLRLATARGRIKRKHCSLGRVSYRRSRVRRNLVVAQRPRAGTPRRRGAPVQLVVSRGLG